LARLGGCGKSAVDEILGNHRGQTERGGLVVGMTGRIWQMMIQMTLFVLTAKKNFSHIITNFAPQIPYCLFESVNFVLTYSGEDTNSMDDLHKRYIDKRFLALSEDYEVQKFEKDVKTQKPNASSTAIHTALLDCAKTLPSNHPREHIMQCVLGKV
jgi:hypothetical protein